MASEISSAASAISRPFATSTASLGGRVQAILTYLQYDARCTEHALRWLAEHRDDAKHWVVFLNFVCPHPPYIAPPEIYAQYPLADVPLAAAVDA